jgi:hypothetical protein
MIGAVILKLALRGAIDDLNNRRKDKIIANYADDAVIIYPGKLSTSGGQRVDESCYGCLALGEFLAL